MNVKIYHNPRCSKSRAAMELLQNKGIEADVKLYLKDGVSFDELSEVVSKLNVPASDIIRFKDKSAKDLNISPKDEKTDDEWIKLMVENPVLIERPIVINGDKAAIGRPLELVENIL